MDKVKKGATDPQNKSVMAQAAKASKFIIQGSTAILDPSWQQPSKRADPWSQAQAEYLLKLADRAQQVHGFPPVNIPEKSNWLAWKVLDAANIDIRGGFSTASRLHSEVYFSLPKSNPEQVAKVFDTLLADHKEEIDAEVGVPVDFQPLPGTKARRCAVYLLRPKGNKPEILRNAMDLLIPAHAEFLAKLRDAFAPRIKSIIGGNTSSK